MLRVGKGLHTYNAPLRIYGIYKLWADLRPVRTLASQALHVLRPTWLVLHAFRPAWTATSTVQEHAYAACIHPDVYTHSRLPGELLPRKSVRPPPAGQLQARLSSDMWRLGFLRLPAPGGGNRGAYTRTKKHPPARYTAK